MNERRSLGSALKKTPKVSDLNPETLAFIHAGTKQAPVATPANVEEPATEERREVPQPKVRETRPKNRNVAPSEPLKEKVMVSFTTRLEQETAAALRTAHLDRKMKRLPLQTQQEILAAAVEDWLRANDYLD